MLNLDKLFLVLVIIFFTKCIDNNKDKEVDTFYKKSISIIDTNQYVEIFNKMGDSLDLWVLNKLRSYEAEYTYDYELDSLMCFNKTGNRLISCIHIFGNQFNSKTDNLIWFYGERINNNWFFFKGACLVLPRRYYSKNENQPLSYQQLHQIALKEVYGGYLKKNGEINEAWFTNHFENVGWCSTCKTTKEFQQSKLNGIKIVWLQRDTTQPIKQLPAKTNLR